MENELRVLQVLDFLILRKLLYLNISVSVVWNLLWLEAFTQDLIA